MLHIQIQKFLFNICIYLYIFQITFLLIAMTLTLGKKLKNKNVNKKYLCNLSTTSIIQNKKLYKKFCMLIEAKEKD